MKFKNKKTGAVLETKCEINGGDWVACKKKAKAKAENPDGAEEGAGENEGTEDDNGDGGTEEGAGEDDKE